MRRPITTVSGGAQVSTVPSLEEYAINADKVQLHNMYQAHFQQARAVMPCALDSAPQRARQWLYALSSLARIATGVSLAADT